jgi:hypothetical protein
MVIEQRIVKVEGPIGQMDKRLNHFGGELRDIRRTMLGILIPMWATIILAIIFGT